MWPCKQHRNERKVHRDDRHQREADPAARVPINDCMQGHQSSSHESCDARVFGYPVSRGVKHLRKPLDRHPWLTAPSEGEGIGMRNAAMIEYPLPRRDVPADIAIVEDGF